MPCTLEPWEIAFEEKRENKEKFGRSITDAVLLEEVACQSIRHLRKTKQLATAPEIVQKWARIHAKKDRKVGR